MPKTFTTEMQVRFRDIDPLWHVSHTVYVTYMQQTRLAFSEEILGMTGDKYDTVVVHLEVDYHDDISRGDTVAVSMQVTDVGRTSFTVSYEIAANGTVASTGESVQVVVDPKSGEKVPVPESWRAAMNDYHQS